MTTTTTLAAIAAAAAGATGPKIGLAGGEVEAGPGEDHPIAQAAAAATEAANARFAALLADPRIRGRERAAFDLALKAPTMSAEAVAAYVAENAKPASRLDGLVPDPKVGAIGPDGLTAREHGRQIALRAKGRADG